MFVVECTTPPKVLEKFNAENTQDHELITALRNICNDLANKKDAKNWNWLASKVNEYISDTNLNSLHTDNFYYD